MAGVVDSSGNVVELRRRPTLGHDVAGVEDSIVELVTELQQQYDVAAVGIGAAGFVDASRSTVMFSPHLAWRNEPLRARVASRITIPVVVDNDANTTALGESRFGAGAGYRYVVCITLGTGIGGAIVVDGRVFRGANGMAGEFGHMQVVPDGHRCPCGNRGCWEQYASGNALEREARELIAKRSPVAHRLIEACGGDPAQLSGPQVTEAARAGRPALGRAARRRRPLARHRRGRAGRGVRPALHRHRRRRLRRRRAAARPDARVDDPLAGRPRLPRRAAGAAGRARPAGRLHRRRRHGPLRRPALAAAPTAGASAGSSAPSCASSASRRAARGGSGGRPRSRVVGVRAGRRRPRGRCPSRAACARRGRRSRR